MEEAKPAASEEKSEKHSGSPPMVHRVCEACNNMFAVPADSRERRCRNCRKE